MNNKRINPILYFLLVYILGIFGVHKFIDGNKKQGVLYLCTFGLCGFGWLYDFINAGIIAIKYLTNKEFYSRTNERDFNYSNTMYTKLRGVRKYCIYVEGLNRQKALEHIAENTPVHLEQLDDIFLVVTNDGIDLGEITAERSQFIKKYPLERISINIKNITGGTDDKYFGCNVKLKLK